MGPVPRIEGALDAVRAAAEAKSIRITTDLDRRGVEISGDANRMQQVMWNLLSNAVAFTPEAGSVHVCLTQGDEQAVVSVRDTGRGIPRSFLPHMFERF